MVAISNVRGFGTHLASHPVAVHQLQVFGRHLPVPVGDEFVLPSQGSTSGQGLLFDHLQGKARVSLGLGQEMIVGVGGHLVLGNAETGFIGGEGVKALPVGNGDKACRAEKVVIVVDVGLRGDPCGIGLGCQKGDGGAGFSCEESEFQPLSLLRIGLPGPSGASGLLGEGHHLKAFNCG